MYRAFVSAVFLSAVFLIVGLAMLGDETMAQDTQSTEKAIDGSPAVELQGEYIGELEVPGEGATSIGFQLIAVDYDEFQGWFFDGGLPGNGWSRGARKNAATDAEINGDEIVFRKGQDKIVISAGHLRAYAGDKVIGSLKRTVRQSPTLGAEPPETAVVLFHGPDENGFEALDGNDAVDGNVLRQGIRTTESFAGDFTLHLEFRLPFEPGKTGQARGNSGLYLQGCYEVQMLDSFGLEGADNECGGIYGVKAPDINMCFPPETWQTYDIEFRAARWEENQKTENARLTVRHNGVLIHDNVEVPGPTTAAPLKESPEGGYLYLQDHGSPVRYRNVWLQSK